MKIWDKLMIQALAAVLIGVSLFAQGEQGSQKTGAQESPQGRSTQGKGPQEKEPQKNSPQKKDPQEKASQQKIAPKKSPQENSTADFRKLDASALPITHKIQIGGDADWLAIGFGSVWVTVAKNNEMVRADAARNVEQARIAVDKEPRYG